MVFEKLKLYFEEPKTSNKDPSASTSISTPMVTPATKPEETSKANETKETSKVNAPEVSSNAQVSKEITVPPKTEPVPSPSKTPKVGDIIDNKWKLVRSDEFDRDGTPEPQNWGYEYGFVRNNELQYYRPENATVKDGRLIIEARWEKKPSPSIKNASYTSSSLITKGKHEFTYGRFEARMKIDIHMGSWPAFWTLGTNIDTTGWPGCGEIDIMEYYTGKVLANICAPKGNSCTWYSKTIQAKDLGGDNWSKEFHIWVMEWDSGRIDLFLDGVLLNHFQVSDSDQTGGSNPFRKPHYLILNQAIGGTSGGDPGNTTFPIFLEVDYVRVYEKIP
ncbi:MAG: family 16 glycosylhydrolase [Oligoflexales bacterium]|nr:family 16 glycosylhydrolase [Oligoflexales bacterium]